MFALSFSSLGLVTNDNAFIFCHNHNITLPVTGQWVAAVVSVVLEANRFWIQLPFGAQSVTEEGATFSDLATCKSTVINYLAFLVLCLMSWVFF